MAITPHAKSYGEDPSLCADVADTEVTETRTLETFRLFSALRRTRLRSARSLRGLLARTAAYVLDGMAIPDHALGWVPFAVWAGVKQNRQSPCDFVLGTGNPWSALVAAGWVSQLTGLPLAIDFQDPWTTQAGFRPRPLNRWASVRIERWLISRARLVVVVNEQMRDSLLRKYGAGISDRTVVVPNGYDADEVVQRQAGTTTGRLRITHVGKFTLYRQPDDVWAMMRALPDSTRSRVELVLVGGAGVDVPCDLASNTTATSWQSRKGPCRQ